MAQKEVFMENKNDEELLKAAKKKFPKWAIALIVLAVTCCACAGVYFLAPGVKEKVDNKIALNTKDSDTYFKDTHKKAVDEKLDDNKKSIEDAAELICDKAGDLIAAKDGKGIFSFASLKLEETGIKSGASIKLTPKIKELLTASIEKEKADDTQDGQSSKVSKAEGMAKVLLDSIDEISVESVSMTNGKDKVYADVAFLLNNKNLIKAELIVDIKEFAVYARIPEISESYVSYKVPKELIDQVKTLSGKALDQLKTQGKDIADITTKLSECLEKHTNDIVPLIKKYADIIIDNLGDVKLDKNKTVDIYDVNVDCTKMTLEIDEAAAKKVVEAVMTELKDDEVIIDFVTSAGLPKEDYVKAIEKALKDIDGESKEEKAEEGEKKDVEADKEEPKLILTSYADSKGDIIAIDFRTNKDDTGIFFGSYEDGATTTSEFKITTVSYVSYVSRSKAAKEEYTKEVESLTTGNEDDVTGAIAPEENTKEDKPSKSTQTFAVYMKDTEDKDSHTGKVILAVKDSSNKDNSISVTVEYKDVKCTGEGKECFVDGTIRIFSDFEQIKDYALSIVLESLEKGQKVTVNALGKDDEELASISAFTQILDYKEIEIPKDSAAINNETAIKAFIKTIKFDTLLGNVKAALNNQQIGALLDMAGTKVNQVFNGNMDDKYVDELYRAIMKNFPTAADKDSENCDDIRSAFNAAITNEAAYNEVIAKGTGRVTLTDGDSISISDMPNLESELEWSLGTLKAPKESGKTQYVLSWTVDNNMIKDVKAVTE